jgi:hypothetical protein
MKKILFCRRSVVIWPKAIVREKDIIKPVRRLPKGGLAIQEHSPSPLFQFLNGLSYEIDFENVDENWQILALIRAAAENQPRPLGRPSRYCKLLSTFLKSLS